MLLKTSLDYGRRLVESLWIIYMEQILATGINMDNPYRILRKDS